MFNKANTVETARHIKGRRSDIFKERKDTQTADRLGNYAKTTLGNQKKA